MKLLIINATPKTDGITYSFVQQANQTASELGIDAHEIRLADEKLKKCIMCHTGWGVCFHEHRCLFGEQDGFTALQKLVQEADAFVYITPVYWGEVSEELKLFLDKLRRCEATKQWNQKNPGTSFHKNKPSILVANAGGGGGGILSSLQVIERAISQMGGDEWPRESAGIFDYIPVNRWNQAYKREALHAAIAEMYAIHTGEKESAPMNKDKYSDPDHLAE